MKTTHLKRFALLTMIGLMFAGFSLAPAMAADEPDDLPTIPKPDFMPGPDEDQTQAEVQEYFRNQAIPNFISGFLGLIAGVSVLALIAAGIRFIASYGEEEGVTQAKKMATYAVIGFGISLLAYAIVGIINTLAFPQEGQDVEQEDIIYENI